MLYGVKDWTAHAQIQLSQIGMWSFYSQITGFSSVGGLGDPPIMILSPPQKFPENNRKTKQ